MDPTDATCNASDYQDSSLYGDTANTSQINATMLNGSASGPNDWLTVLTNGISGAAVNGINGMVNNAVVSGQLQNVKAAQAIKKPANAMMLMILLAVGYFVLEG